MNFLLAASEAERAAQQTRIRLLQRERRRLQVELTLSHAPARELDLKRTFAAVTIDIEASAVAKTALETRISMRKHEQRRLEAELTRELAAAGETPPPTSSTQPSLVEAASSASASDAGPHHGPLPVADTSPWRADQAAWCTPHARVLASGPGP